jgi:hypothetical protein
VSADVTVDRVAERLPGLLPMAQFLDRTTVAARAAGFDRAATLPVVSVCRDELMIAFIQGVVARWGPPFLMGGLGGLTFAGRSGLLAAAAHAPDVSPPRYLLYVLAHVGVSEAGVVGEGARPGQERLSHACGALAHYHHELVSGTVPAEPDPQDVEMGVLRRRLRPLLPQDHLPDMLELTLLVEHASLEDLTSVAAFTGHARGMVALFAGIVVHAPSGDYVAPGLSELRHPRHTGRPSEPLAW